MEKLPPPLKKYLSGKLPTHSSTVSLSENFRNLDENVLFFVFNKAGYLNDDRKPTKQAVSDGLIDTCERKALWNLEAVDKKLNEMGVHVERQVVNQDMDDTDDGIPKWVNLGTISTYFSVSANTVGKWLDELNLREGTMANDSAMEQGLAMVTEMNAGGKKTRKITMWNLVLTRELLVDNGHELDFDYDRVLKGRGKNSDVQVVTLDDRAKEFAKNFVETFKDPVKRYECDKMVRSQPQVLLKKAEEILKKPGFLTQEKYKKYLNKK